MSAPVLPFDPTRTPSGRLRVSLSAACANDASWAFLEKVRALAQFDNPEMSRAIFVHLNNLLGSILADVRTPTAARQFVIGANPKRIGVDQMAELVASVQEALGGWHYIENRKRKDPTP